MRGERYVLLGLARARSEWFRSVAQWSTAGAIPAEFYKCVSAEELRARLASGRPFSAALLDGGLPSTDRDLIAAVRDSACVPMIVDDGRDRDWSGLGIAAVLDSTVTREQLLDALATHANMVSSGAPLPHSSVDPGIPAQGTAPLVAVCGSGGTGASSVAVALAQGLTSGPLTGPVLLADFCRVADQAMLHDARDVVPGVQELVELHRGGRPTMYEVHAQTFHVAERGYQLLLGLRRPRYWSALRPRSFEAAVTSLRHTFGALVCDIEPDLEGEADGGSPDVEERNLMARTVTSQASAVFLVGRADLPGVHGMVRLAGDLARFGVPAGRIVPVVNQVARRPRLRAELTQAYHELVKTSMNGAEPLPPLFLPVRRVDEALRDGVPMPPPLPAILAGAFHGLIPNPRLDAVSPPETPARIEPGSIGALT